MKERIKAIREDADLTQKEFADRLGVTMNYVYMMESGRREPSVATAREICRQFSVNEVWLATGQGEMHRDLTPAMKAAEAVRRLLIDEAGTPAAAVVSELLALDPHGPEWEVLGDLLYRVIEQLKKDSEK